MTKAQLTELAKQAAGALTAAVLIAYVLTTLLTGNLPILNRMVCWH